MIVASGLASLPPDDFERRTRSELDDVARVLDVAHRQDARAVVVGSSDVCGLAAAVNGSTPVDPVTRYAVLKAQREEVVVDAANSGLDVAAVRLAPTHGPGKAQTRRMVSLAKQNWIVLPRGGRYSVGFVALDDAVNALQSLAVSRSSAVVSVGAGETILRHLLQAIGLEAGRSPTIVPVPVPIWVARRVAASANTKIAWLGRLSLPKSVDMEADVDTMSTTNAARFLLGSVGER